MAYGLEKLRSMDDAYSAKIAALYDQANPAVQAAAYLVGGAHPSFRKAEPEYREGAGGVERLLGDVSQYAIPAANAVPKYVLPAAGVTAAGIGLMNISQALGSAMANQQTSMSQHERALSELLQRGEITEEQFLALL